MIRTDFLKHILPTGSGINCDWKIDRVGKYIRCRNSFYCFDEHGFDDGFADFKVLIPRKQKYPHDFKLQFEGYNSQYKAKKYWLREMLENTIAYSLENIKA